MNRIVRIVAVPAVVVVVVVLAVVLLATGLVHVDWLPGLHTYGLSFGTNSHYCFADFVRSHLTAGCESAR